MKIWTRITQLAAVVKWKSRQKRGLFHLSADAIRLAGNLFFSPASWNPEPVEMELTNSGAGETYKNVGFFIHLFYVDFVQQAVALLANYGNEASFYFTTSSEVIQKRILEEASALGLEVEIRLVPNRGRNFGPLFVEFSRELLLHEFSVHLHSKKSPQNDAHKSSKWASSSWNLLGLDTNLFAKLLGILEMETNIGIAFAIDLFITPPSSFGWGMNEDLGKELLNAASIQQPDGPFIFPAGGMFIARGRAIRQLLDLHFDYRTFPQENGEFDGTLQHALERVLGLVSLKNDMRILLFDVRTNTFTFDTTFLKVKEK